MLFNDDVLFIHIGKTGGMSCAHYLLRVLKPPLYNCHRKASVEQGDLRRKGITPITEINRHCTLRASRAHLDRLLGRQLSDFQRIIAVIRNPYSLEYSFYRHLQKAAVRERRRGNRALLELTDGGFTNFVRNSGYHRPGLRQEDYFLVDGVAPDNLVLVRFEKLVEQVCEAVAPFVIGTESSAFPHLNASENHPDLNFLLSNEVRELIYIKHRYMFDSGLYQV